MVKLIKHLALSLFFLTLVVGGYLLYSEVTFGQGQEIRLWPLVTNTNSKPQPTATITPVIKIEDKIASSTAFYPGTLLTTYKGDDLLVLVNKQIGLPASYIPGDLVSLNGVLPTTADGFYLRKEASQHLQEMFTAAKNDGVNLRVTSPYRSYYQQQVVFNNWVKLAGLKQAESFSARPGHSQHQLGTAVDLAAANSNSPFNEDFGATKEGQWLVNNAYKFGFGLSYPKGKEKITGYSYEPWHWRYIGVENAQKMLASGLILEEFLNKFGTW